MYFSIPVILVILYVVAVAYRANRRHIQQVAEKMEDDLKDNVNSAYYVTEYLDDALASEDIEEIKALVEKARSTAFELLYKLEQSA